MGASPPIPPGPAAGHLFTGRVPRPGRRHGVRGGPYGGNLRWPAAAPGGEGPQSRWPAPPPPPPPPPPWRCRSPARLHRGHRRGGGPRGPRDCRRPRGRAFPTPPATRLQHADGPARRFADPPRRTAEHSLTLRERGDEQEPFPACAAGAPPERSRAHLAWARWVAISPKVPTLRCRHAAATRRRGAAAGRARRWAVPVARSAPAAQRARDGHLVPPPAVVGDNVEREGQHLPAA